MNANQINHATMSIAGDVGMLAVAGMAAAQNIGTAMRHHRELRNANGWVNYAAERATVAEGHARALEDEVDDLRDALVARDALVDALEDRVDGLEDEIARLKSEMARMRLRVV